MRTDLISPSPTAANLGKYGNMPVNYYTGVPDVSIPVFTVTGNELTLPITLTYNYNGHQPLHKASWVGLGWSLQAGGVISRTIGDKVETTTTGYNRDSASQINPSQTYLRRSYEFSTFDNMPDIYSFNFGSYSGKFILHNGTAHIMPYQKLKITGGPGGSFTITTEKGIRYEFTQIEQTTPKPSAGAPYTIPTHTSSWYLTRITNASGTESIRLTYDSDGLVLQFGPKTQTYNKLIASTGSPAQPTYPGQANQVFPTRVSAVRLASIVSDKYTVTFDPGAVREDLEVEGGASQSLESIIVSTVDGSVVKYLDFEYGYFGGGVTQHAKYLKLRSISDRGIGAADVFMKHTFDYYNESGNFGVGSTTYVDKYGYLKSGSSMPGSMYISNEIYPGGSDRSPSFSAAVSGALKTITYPTGGSTTFTYEQNMIFDGEKYVVNDLYAGDMAYRSDPATSHTITKDTPPFEITQSQTVSITFSRIDKVPYNPETSPVEVDHDNTQEVEVRRFVNIVDEEGNVIGSSVGSVVFTGKIVLNADNGGLTKTFTLGPGRYIVRFICDKDELNVSGNLTYKYHTNTPIVGIPGPGIRLSQMVHADGQGNEIKKRYGYLTDNGFATGVLLQSNVFDSKPYEEIYYTVLQPLLTEATRTHIAYTSALGESVGIGLPFYYNRVTEETFSDQEVHRTKYEYEYFPGTQTVELVRKTDYEQTSSGFIPKAREENTFSIEQSDAGFASMEVYIDALYIYQPQPDVVTHRYGFQHNVHAVYWKHPHTNRKIQIENGREFVTQTRSFYDSKRNLVGKRVSLSDGSSVYTKYKYPEDYSGVSSASSLVTAHMLSSVIEEQVWRKDADGDSLMISGKINVYSGTQVSDIYAFESENGIAAPASETKNAQLLYTSLISDNTHYKRKIKFKYDASGRVVSQQLEKHAPLSYLWGHTAFALSGSPGSPKIYPIAEIKNAVSDSVFHTSFEDASGTAVPEAVTGNKAFSGTLAIPGSYAGKYRLTYWKKPDNGTGTWTLVEVDHYNPSGISINEPGYLIDEVRLCPKKSQITTYTYKADRVLTECDPNNMVTYYEYDLVGRLSCVRDHRRKIVKTYDYRVVTESHGIPNPQ